jgi:hypothetical protein
MFSARFKAERLIEGGYPVNIHEGSSSLLGDQLQGLGGQVAVPGLDVFEN